MKEGVVLKNPEKLPTSFMDGPKVCLQVSAQWQRREGGPEQSLFYLGELASTYRSFLNREFTVTKLSKRPQQ